MHPVILEIRIYVNQRKGRGVGEKGVVGNRSSCLWFSLLSPSHYPIVRFIFYFFSKTFNICSCKSCHWHPNPQCIVFQNIEINVTAEVNAVGAWVLATVLCTLKCLPVVSHDILIQYVYWVISYFSFESLNTPLNLLAPSTECAIWWKTLACIINLPYRRIVSPLIHFCQCRNNSRSFKGKQII